MRKIDTQREEASEIVGKRGRRGGGDVDSEVLYVAANPIFFFLSFSLSLSIHGKT